MNNRPPMQGIMEIFVNDMRKLSNDNAASHARLDLADRRSSRQRARGS